MSCRAAVRTAAAAFAVLALLATSSGRVSASTTAGGPGTLIVQPGDSLWRIAMAHGLTVNELAVANAMSPNDLLLIGRRLTIPEVASPGAASPGASSPGASSPSPSAGRATVAAPNPDFCAETAFFAGPSGQIPALLASSPDRLALRPLFVKWGYAYGVAPELAEAVAWQESGWQENVVSGDGAVGIGQLLPSTADFVNNYLLGTDLNINVASDNIRMEVAFLAYLIRQVGDNPCEVAAAYYQGPAALASYGVFAQSEQYVRDVLALEPEFS